MSSLTIVREALARLQQSLAEQCGPDHRYERHGDLDPPYCRHCNVTDTGLARSAIGHGKTGRRLGSGWEAT